jgi:hypothetical protein
MSHNPEIITEEPIPSLHPVTTLRRTYAFGGEKLPKGEQKKKAKGVTPAPRPQQQPQVGRKG